MQDKNRTRRRKRRITSRPRRRAATSRSRQRAVATRRRRSRKPVDIQKHAFQVFAEQADSLWNGLTEQCRQFAGGFNGAAGTTALHVHADPNSVRVEYPQIDAQLCFQLDRSERYLQVWVNSGCATYGTCLTDLLPVGLTVNGDELQFVLGGDVVSDERLVVRLLTQLTTGSPEQPQEPS
jgi:hypothetical protein